MKCYKSTEKTRVAAVQRSLLQGQLRRGSPALSGARRPSPPAGKPALAADAGNHDHNNAAEVSGDESVCEAFAFFFFFFPEQNGKIDMTFFTHDCFHFTIKGHEELAKGLWNNMVCRQ